MEVRGGGVNVGVSRGVGTSSSFLSHTVTVSEETVFLAVLTFAVGRNGTLINRTLNQFTRQAMYVNVTMRRVVAAIVAEEKQ